jgi:hypothetical protein
MEPKYPNPKNTHYSNIYYLTNQNPLYPSIKFIIELFMFQSPRFLIKSLPMKTNRCIKPIPILRPLRIPLQIQTRLPSSTIQLSIICSKTTSTS